MKTSKEVAKEKDAFRCFECGKLLAKTDLNQTDIEIKCHRCGVVNSIFKNMDQQVIITSPNGTILYANSLVEKTTGFSMGEILGANPSLWGNQMPKKFYEKLWKTIQEKKPISVKVTNRRKDGFLYNAILQISPVLDTEGNIAMFVGIESVVNTTN